MSLALAPGPPGAEAGHGGAVRLSAVRLGPYAVSAWTRPTPPQVGATTVDVAVMRPADRAPVAGAGVRLTARPVGHAASAVTAAASPDADPLGVRYRTDLVFPSAGRWEVLVAVRGPDGEGTTSFPLDVVAPRGWLGVALGTVAAAAGIAGVGLARRRRARVVAGLVLGFGAGGVPAATGQPGDHAHPPGTAAHEHPGAPQRATMQELHAHGGVPPGWRFTFPDGDAAAGRGVFAKLECYKCHAVHGESFPNAPRQAGESGPALTGMGTHHPAEYFAESILNPNAVIVTGSGHTGPDGLSVMPDYREALTVAELVDLVAYLRSLGGPASGQPASGAHDHGAGAPGSGPATPGKRP